MNALPKYFICIHVDYTNEFYVIATSNNKREAFTAAAEYSHSNYVPNHVIRREMVNNVIIRPPIDIYITIG